MHLWMRCELFFHLSIYPSIYPSHRHDLSQLYFIRYHIINIISYHLDYSFFLYRLQSGYSRFPVHEKRDQGAFIGLLLVKTVRGWLFFYTKQHLLTFFFGIAFDIWSQDGPPSLRFSVIDITGSFSVHKLLPSIRLFVRLI